MRVVSACATVRNQVRVAQKSGRRVGFVPTMGALHDGHLSLVDQALQTCDFVVVSIFVNPTQFAANEDLDQYPRPLESDLKKLHERGVQMVFRPSIDEMYPAGYSTMLRPPAVANVLEGQHRPEHFAGVATVVAKLFNAVPADLAVFGQKDFQQFKVIEAVVRDLNIGIELSAAPIVRESDGLAMSSRNAYLSPCDRQRSLAISRSLQKIQVAIHQGEMRVPILESLMLEYLTVNDGVDSVDYAVIVDSNSLHSIDSIGEHQVALVAAHVGGTRLIDNQILRLP